jgi:predicted transcriptional regulator
MNMEEMKKKLLAALKANRGRYEEAVVGENIGLTEDELDKVLDELVREGKLEHQTIGICSYVVTGR